MTERLQKILSSRGLCSRRKAEEWITAGRVTVNGMVAALGDSADPDTDEILVDGKALPKPDDFVYIMLNKPRGYVTTLSDEKGRPNAAQLVDCGKRVYPVGRLDMERYSEEKLEKLKLPIELDGYLIRKPDVKLLRTRERGQAQILVTIHEGRNRQVRRMCDAAGMNVLRLQRVAEGKLKLGDLPLGKWRHLTREELAGLE